MRERRVMMLLGIVLAVFVLGLAYAAVSTQLEITGNATGNFDPSNFQVIFSGVSGVTGTKGVNTSGSTATIPRKSCNRLVHTIKSRMVCLRRRASGA